MRKWLVWEGESSNNKKSKLFGLCDMKWTLKNKKNNEKEKMDWIWSSSYSSSSLQSHMSVLFSWFSSLHFLLLPPPFCSLLPSYWSNLPRLNRINVKDASTCLSSPPTHLPTGSPSCFKWVKNQTYRDFFNISKPSPLSVFTCLSLALMS